MKTYVTRQRAISAFVVLATCSLLLGVNGCDKAKSASVAVNRYGESLSHFQDAEIKWHDQGKVDDSTHRAILNAEKVAAKEGQNLDSAISVALRGGDVTAYIGPAESSFQTLLPLLHLQDPQAQQDLTTLLNASGALLQNAISLLQAVHASNTGGAVAAAPKSAGMGLWLLLGLLFPMAVVGGATLSVAGVVQLLNAISVLEPIAFDLVLKLAHSLKGQTTEQVLAMNETLFGKVESVADEELAKLDAKQPPPTPA